MSVMDKMKDMLTGHQDQAKQAVQKAGDAIDAKTGGKYESKVDKAQNAADQQIDRQSGGGGNQQH